MPRRLPPRCTQADHLKPLAEAANFLVYLGIPNAPMAVGSSSPMYLGRPPRTLVGGSYLRGLLRQTPSSPRRRRLQSLSILVDLRAFGGGS